MKKLLILTSLILLMQVIFYGCNTAPKTWNKSGSVLTYQVVDGSKSYNFIVTDLIMENSISFSWQMTAPANSSGKVVINENAIEEATQIVNYFSDGSSQKMENETTIWISRGIFRSIKNKNSYEINIDGNTETLTYNSVEKYKFDLDGNKQEVDVLVAETDQGSKFWILDDDKYPLILKMEVGFTIELVSVK